MAIITLASSKGGAGKSTLARILAATYAQSYRVGVVDSDRNPALYRWVTKHKLLNTSAVHETDEHKIIDVIADLHDSSDLVIIDTAGAETQAALLAMSAADLILIPSQLSHDDIFETLKTHRWAKQAKERAKQHIEIRSVLTRLKTHTKLAETAPSILSSNNVPTLPMHIRDLVAFTEMSHLGELPQEKEARADIERLMKAVNEIIEPILDAEHAEKITNQIKKLSDERHAQA